MKFSQKNIENWRSWKTQFFWVGHFEFYFSNFFIFFCFIPMKISHKLCVRMDGTQFLLLLWFTAKNEGGNHIIAWVYARRHLNHCGIIEGWHSIILWLVFNKFSAWNISWSFYSYTTQEKLAKSKNLICN